MYNIRYILKQGLLAILLFTITLAIGQRRGVGDFIPQDAEVSRDTTGNTVEKDSFLHDYILLNNIDQKLVFGDTSLGNYFNHYDPSRKRDFDFLTLGNLGSAHYSSIFNPQIRTGFNAGFNQYNLFNKELETFKYYDVNRPLADLGFFPFIGQQGSFLVSAEVGQTFKDGISMAINYDRIVQDGIFDNQAIKHTNVGIGFRIKTKGDKLNTFVTLISNVNTESNNGGVTTDSLFFNDAYRIRKVIPVYLSDAKTRHDQKLYSIQNVFRFGDTIADASDLLLTHRFNVENKTVKFSDINIKSLDNYYDDLYVDERGLRYFLKYSKISNSFSFQNSGEQKINGRLGIRHDFIKIDNGEIQSKRNDLTAFANGILPIKNVFEVNLNGELGLGSNIGRFSFDGNIDLLLKQYLELNIGTNIFNAEQSYISKFVVVNDNLLFQRPGSFSFGNKLYATLNIPLTKTKIGVRQTIINNPIYWDNNFEAREKNGILCHSVIKIDQKLKLGPLHFDNSGYYQILSDSIYNLPNWMTKHSLYYSGRIFKKVMEIKTGFDLRLIPKYTGSAYSPLIGQFYTDSSAELDLYPYTDFFFVAKISTLRVFFRMDNLGAYFLNDVHFQFKDYPLSDPQIRFGIRWQLLD